MIPEPGAKTGTESIPSSMYIAMLRPPRLLPSAPPARSTLKVWPVMGTVVVGIFTANWAHSATSRTPLAMRIASSASLFTLSVTPRLAVSTSARTLCCAVACI